MTHSDDKASDLPISDHGQPYLKSGKDRLIHPAARLIRRSATSAGRRVRAVARP